MRGKSLDTLVSRKILQLLIVTIMLILCVSLSIIWAEAHDNYYMYICPHEISVCCSPSVVVVIRISFKFFKAKGSKSS